MIHVPLITPFGADGRVATAALEGLAHELLRDGASGLVALGTTGEPATLEAEERAEVVRIAGRVCRARGARFVVGVGASGTRRAARELDALGTLPVVPDAALVTVPSFTRPGEAGVLAHFRTLAAASPVPLLAYHIPHRTGQALTAATLLELAAIPGVTGLKYATGAIDTDAVALLVAVTAAAEAAQALPVEGAQAAQAEGAEPPHAGRPDGPAAGGGTADRSAGGGAADPAEVPATDGVPAGHGAGGPAAGGAAGALPRGADRRAAGGGAGPGDDFEVLAGDDVFAPAMFALGARGGILAAAHLATARWVELAATGERALGHRLAALALALFREPNPGVIKAVLHAQGRIPTPDVRSPLLPASRPALAAALRAAADLELGRAAPEPARPT